MISSPVRNNQILFKETQVDLETRGALEGFWKIVELKENNLTVNITEAY